MRQKNKMFKQRIRQNVCEMVAWFTINNKMQVWMVEKIGLLVAEGVAMRVYDKYFLGSGWLEALQWA